MAVTMIAAQHFYDNNLLQYVTLYSSGFTFDVAYADLQKYIDKVNAMEEYHAYTADIENLTISKTAVFVEDEPQADTEHDLHKNRFIITATFKRREVAT